jgi:hypothetical protein
MADKNKSAFARLSDSILQPLELALDQKDVPIAEHLMRALEMAMTRNAGGKDFTERREYPPEIEKAIERLLELKKNS